MFHLLQPDCSYRVLLLRPEVIIIFFYAQKMDGGGGGSKSLPLFYDKRLVLFHELYVCIKILVYIKNVIKTENLTKYETCKSNW